MRTKKREQEINAEALCKRRLEAMQHAIDIEDYEELEQDENALRASDVLAVDKRVSFDVELSWGGPADRIRFYVEGYDLVDVEYHYSDWFYHYEVELSPDERQTILDWGERILDLGNHEAWK